MSTIICDKCSSGAIPVGMAPDKTLGLFWICTNCDNRWHYWKPSDPYYDRAQRFISNPHYPLTQVEP